MADSSLPPIIVIKRKKAGGHGHHGGAWKVAYADFVTAMMAFFLLLWLLSVTTEEQRSGIADYFAPTVASVSASSGSGRVLDGATITVEGRSVSAASPVAASAPMPTDGTNNDFSEEELQGRPTEEDFTSENPPPPPKVEPGKPTEEEIDKAIEEREQKAFDQVAEELKNAIKDNPDLAILEKSIIIDMTPEGLRIQLVDQEGYSMFPRGSAVMAPRTRDLINLVARAITPLPNKLSISGHTDSTPFTNTLGNYGNWELSSDRANAARRLLINGDISIDRIATVVGRADREPFVKEDPTDPRNRRLSIILMKQSLTGNSPYTTQSPAPAATPPATTETHPDTPKP